MFFPYVFVMNSLIIHLVSTVKKDIKQSVGLMYILYKIYLNLQNSFFARIYMQNKLFPTHKLSTFLTPVRHSGALQMCKCRQILVLQPIRKIVFFCFRFKTLPCNGVDYCRLIFFFVTQLTVVLYSTYSPGLLVVLENQ